MLKTIIEKLEKEEEEEDNDVNADMTQLERRNNKCYALAFRNIQTSRGSRALRVIIFLRWSH